jgi:hypothetical protein
MPVEIKNCNEIMLALANQTVNKFGLDQTEKISYTFNSQGFRSDFDYNFVPEYAFFGCSLVFGIGVSYEHIFPSKFVNSQNYGLAGIYNNEEIYQSCINFVQSELYEVKTKKVVVWAPRNQSLIKYYHLLEQYNFVHLFCDNRLSNNNCWPMIRTIDSDVSNTHMGPITHKALYKTLCQIVKNQ